MGSCTERVKPFSATMVRGAVNVTADNCEGGGILAKSVVLDVLAAADGATFGTQASAGTPGDFLRVQPIEGVIKVHYIFFSTAAASDLEEIGYGQILKNRKQKQPTLDGSWDTDNVCATAANFPLDDGVGMNINTFNPQCIPAATNDSPVDVAMFNNTAADITACVTIVYENIG